MQLDGSRYKISTIEVNQQTSPYKIYGHYLRYDLDHNQATSCEFPQLWS